MQWTDSYDLVIIGSGGGSMCAALRAKALGRRALILEKQDVIGGSTSYSGGVLWLPNNPMMGTRDTEEKSALYLKTLTADAGPAASPARRAAYIAEGREMVTFLQERGMKFHNPNWPDYYSDAPGGTTGGRSLTAELFDVNALGSWADRLGSYAGYPPLPLQFEDTIKLTLMKRTWRGRYAAFRLALSLARQQLLRTRVRGFGNALQGRMLQIALKNGIPLWRGAVVSELVLENDTATGVVVNYEGRAHRIEALGGVLINTGGFSHNLPMREQYQPHPASVRWTAANPGDTGEIMQMAQRMGAAVDLMNESWWCPMSFKPDGTPVGFHVPMDTAKPHCIVVNAAGRRFTNEANSYMEFGQRMFASDAVPAYVILESRNRQNYTWGSLLPGKTPDDLVRSGYMRKAETIADLARQCGLDGAALCATVARFNGFVDAGVDADFARGGSAFNRFMGDPTYTRNACLGHIAKPPFYAIQLQPADVGTCGGLLTDEHARVLRGDGSAISGLYATGNATASVMGRTYPGAGASIGASFVFGYIAAGHACGANQ